MCVCVCVWVDKPIVVGTSLHTQPLLVRTVRIVRTFSGPHIVTLRTASVGQY